MSVEMLRRFFAETLRWDAPGEHAPVKIARYDVEAQPLARAASVMVLAVTAEAPLRRRALRRQLFKVLERKLHEPPLLVFVDEAAGRAIWRWQQWEQETALPPQSPESVPWLAQLVLPLTMSPTAADVTRRLDAAFSSAALSQSLALSQMPLLVALDQALQAVEAMQRSAAELAQRAFLDETVARLDEVERLRQSLLSFRDKLRTLRDEGEAIYREFPALAQGATKGEAPSPSAEAAAGRTPQGDYRCPILRALIELGGSARVGDVLERIYAQMQARLLPGDFELRSNGEPVWRNTAKWERKRMVEEGLLYGDSPVGLWEITRKGRRYYETHCRRSKGKRA